MPRSHRRQGQSTGGRNSQGYRARCGGYGRSAEYRQDDQSRGFGSPQFRRESGQGWQGEDAWRNERSGMRNYGQDLGQESRFGRGGYEGMREPGEEQWSSQGYPESYRDDWGRSVRGGDYGS